MHNLPKTIFTYFRFGLKISLILIIICGCSSSDREQKVYWNWTESTQFGRCPKWSPYGEKIIFGDDREGITGIHIWDTESDPVRLTDSLHFHNWDYCWSPDGESIAFTSPGTSDDSLAGIWILNIPSGQISNLYKYGKDVNWYTSGNELAIRSDNPPDGEPGIYRLTLNEDKTEVTETSLTVQSGHQPTCSPHNNWLAYNDNEIDGRMHLLDSEGAEQFVSGNGVRQMNWSADGTYLSFIINNYTSGVLESILWGISTADPTAADSLTRMAAYPAPDKNGTEIAYSRLESGHWAGLWLFEQRNGTSKIATLGLNPDYHPTMAIIAVNSSLGGIRILVRE